MRYHVRALIGFAAIGCASLAEGSVISGTGATTIVSPPASVLLGASESNTNTMAFDEVQNFLLPVSVAVDITAVGLVSAAGDLTPGVIPAGTRVSSHLLRSDPIGSGVSVYEGSATFDGLIVGIIVNRQLLNLSDAALGNPLTTYGDYEARGLEIGGGDTVRLVVGRTTVTYRFSTSTATDDIRVITIVPATSSAGVLGLAGLAALKRRRR